MKTNKNVRLKELTKVRVTQEKQLKKLQNEEADLLGKVAKKTAQVNALLQQLALTNEKLAGLAAEIAQDVAKQNKAY